MRPIATFVDQTLTWIRPKVIKSDYELRFGDELIATLRFPSFFSSSAIAESADGCWTFKRIGFFKKRTIIGLSGSSDIIGTYRKNAWKKGGFLELSDSRKFIVTASLWKNTIQFQTDSGETLIHMKSRGVFRLSVTVQMYRTCLHIPEFTWMVILGLYLFVMMERDRAHATAAAG